jgi:hypothetical protein
MAKAVNTDSRTLRNARIGTQLVEYYFTDPAHDLERDYSRALEVALLAGEAFITQDWDQTLGEEAGGDLETGEIVPIGDVAQVMYTPWNTARDLGAQDATKCHWFIFSERVNKYELAAKFPAYAEEIVLNATSNSGVVATGLMRPYSDDTDYVEVHRLVHFPSRALEQGRVSLFINDSVLFDTVYPYKNKKVLRISDREVIETAFGHTSNYDLLGLEQVTDSLHSVIINNALTFGINTIVGPKGSGIVQTELAKG